MEEIYRKFDHRLIHPSPHVIALLAQIESIRGEFKATPQMNPQRFHRLQKTTIITSTGASTRIEGSKLSDAEVEKIMRGLSTPQFADRDHQEVQGYLETLQNVFEAYETLPLRESVIVSLHQQLLKYSVKDDLHRGEYKKKENTVGVSGPEGKILKILFETTPAYLTAKEMQELVEWANVAFEKERFNPLLIIANFVVEFLKIHPFEDGNGRLSRVLTNLLLLRSGYSFVQYVSHEQIIERRKEQYYFALRKSQETFNSKTETIAPWLDFFFSTVHEQAEKALYYFVDEPIEDILSPRQEAVWAYFETTSEATPLQITKVTGIALGTVRQALNRLVALGKLKRVGLGRGTRYVKIS